MLLPFHPKALEDLDESVRWYERRERGLGSAFFDEVQRGVAWASRFPKGGPLVLGLPEERDVRRFRLRRFPFVIVTATVADERWVLAVAHTSRQPAYWRNRVP